jgi:single-stranded DNA-binding protein
MRLAVPRHARGGRREPGVVYIAVTTFGLEARDCAERLRRGDRIGVTGRIEQDKHRTPEGRTFANSGLSSAATLRIGDVACGSPQVSCPPSQGARWRARQRGDA